MKKIADLSMFYISFQSWVSCGFTFHIKDFILAAVFIWRLILQPNLNKVYVESSLSAESEKDISDLIILLQSWG